MSDCKTAKRVFADTLSDMMREMGMDTEHYDVSDLKSTIAICTAQFDVTWADLIQWVEHGDDQRAKTLDVLRASLEVGRMWA